MDTKVRQGLALLVIAGLAFVLSLPARGSTGGAGYVWLGITSVATGLGVIVGGALLVAGLLKPQRD